MIAAAVLSYLADQEPAPSPVRWVEHQAEEGAFVVEYQLADGRIVPIRFHEGDRPRYLMSYVDAGRITAGRITAATRIDAARAPVRS